MPEPLSGCQPIENEGIVSQEKGSFNCCRWFMYDWSLNYVAYSHEDFDGLSVKKLLTWIYSALGPNGHINFAFNNPEILRQESIGPVLQENRIVKNFDILIRDNKRREFGAYEDLSHLNNSRKFHPNSLHIFVNTTWDKHREVSGRTAREIISSFRSAVEFDKPLFLGPWSTFGKPFTMNGVLIHAWVCTYMFVYNQMAINKGGLQLTPKDIVENYFGDVSTEEKYFSDSLHPLLKQRWEAWFFGLHQNLPRWYGAKKLVEYDPEFLKGKVTACIDEHYLTRTAIAKNFATPPMLKKFTGT